MQNAIDFRELRRRERQRIHSSKQTYDGRSISGGDDDGSTTQNNNGGLSVQLPNNETSLGPYESLLPQNQLSEDIHRIGSPTTMDSVLYEEKFLSSAQAKEVMSWLNSIPEYSQHHGNSRGTLGIRQTEREESVEHNGKWTQLKHARRKVALFDGTICNLPHILQRLSNTLVAIGAFPPSHPPNHVLVNEYQPGEGILPHTDGPSYESRTATISLGGSDVIFKLWPRQQHNDAASNAASTQSVRKIPFEVILHGNGSLVLFTNDAYLNHCHEICEVLEETTSINGICGNDINGGTLVKRGYRVSLTFRCKK